MLAHLESVSSYEYIYVSTHLDFYRNAYLSEIFKVRRLDESFSLIGILLYALNIFRVVIIEHLSIVIALFRKISLMLT